MTDPNFHIRTPRLYLSHLQPEDPDHCDFLARLYNSPEFIAAEGETKIKTVRDAQEVISNRFRKDHARNGYGQYLLSKEPSDWDHTSASGSSHFGDDIKYHTLIGTVSLMRGEGPDAFSAPDLGFAILPEHMRKGYAREACIGLMEDVERALGQKDILGLHDPANKGSAAVFRSLGFKDMGLHVLKAFGGVTGQVWIKKDMDEDLKKYGFDE